MPIEQPDLIYSLLRRGERRAVIAARAGMSLSTVYAMLRRLGGMTRPVDAEYHSRSLSELERLELAPLRDGGQGVRAIARTLGRSPATISRELRRNAQTTSGMYLPHVAHTLAWKRQRRAKQSKIASNPRLAAHVQARLKKRDSPEPPLGCTIRGYRRTLHPNAARPATTGTARSGRRRGRTKPMSARGWLGGIGFAVVISIPSCCDLDGVLL